MVLSSVRSRLRTQLSAAVHSAYAAFAQQAALVTRTNPQATVHQILARPDVSGHLASGTTQARAQAQAIIRQAWQLGGGLPDSPVLQELLADSGQLWDVAQEGMREAVHQAYESVPPAQFQPGVTPPGAQPMMEAAQRRAEAVADAIRSQADRLLVSARASLAVAATHSGTDSVLAQGRELQDAGYRVGKRWVSRLAANTCHWCRQLHGSVVPLDAEFDHGTVHAFGHQHLRHVRTEAGSHRYHRPIGAPIIMTHPPAVWGGHLWGPPRHPECQCTLEIVILGAGEGPEPQLPPEPEQEHPYVHASDIAAMPDAQYSGLLTFVTAAVHELGQLLRRLLGL